MTWDVLLHALAADVAALERRLAESAWDDALPEWTPPALPDVPPTTDEIARATVLLARFDSLRAELAAALRSLAAERDGLRKRARAARQYVS